MIPKSVRNVTVSALMSLVVGLFAPQWGNAQTFSVFYSFTTRQSAPFGIIRDGAGNFYGTTTAGGLNGTGTIYRLSPAGKDTVLYQFGPSPDASAPGALMRSSDGNFYGTSIGGGAFGYGTIFKFGAAGEQVLYSFTGGSDGSSPSLSGVVEDAEGNLYGTTINGMGTVFKLSSSGELTTLHTFTGGNDGNLATIMMGTSDGVESPGAGFDGFVGSLSNPLQDPYVVGYNEAQVVNGTWYSGHALDTMQQYRIVPSVVEDALTSGTMDFGNRPLTFTFTTPNVVVVMNAGGGVMTVIPQ